MPPDPATRPRPAMLRDPHAYILVRTVAPDGLAGRVTRRDRCGTRILDPARVGSDPVALVVRQANYGQLPSPVARRLNCQDSA